jgi:hypothetical protein
MSYMGSALPTGIIPIGMLVRPYRDANGRLTEWGVAMMTAAQNTAILQAEKKAGRKLTNPEKLGVIAEVQKGWGFQPRFNDPLPRIPGFDWKAFWEQAWQTTQLRLRQAGEAVVQPVVGAGNALGKDANPLLIGALAVGALLLLSRR